MLWISECWIGIVMRPCWLLMVRSCYPWLSTGFMFSLFMVMVTLSSGTECVDNGRLKEKPKEGVSVTMCALHCTQLTYGKQLAILDTRTIRFTDSETDNLGNYCWSMPMKCSAGEHFQHAYIMLPAERSEVEGSLKVTLLPQDDTLQPQHNPPLLPDPCGVAFDVSAYFITEYSWPKLCVQIISQQSTMGNASLRCPPFLVAMWQKGQNPSPANPGSG